MRKTAFISFFVWTTQSFALNPSDTRYPRDVVTVDFLYETCSVVGETARGKIPFFDCESYVYGVLDAYLSTRPYIPEDQRACIPSDLPPWKVLEDARPLIDEGQESRTAAPALMEALRKKYPCSPPKAVH